ncbi:MAG: PqqD family protein [Candidatus Latescibacteria bacterium]|nr:PqqD family protein [Candidatus Latescibacterota bacterium]
MGIFATKTPKLSRQAMLNSRPARNELLSWEQTEAGEVQITIQRQDTWKVRLLSKVFYIPKERKITLDALGTEVWQLCTGRATVGQIIEALAEKYQLNRKEAEVSLLSYLKTLGQKRFIGFVLETEGQGGRKRGSPSGKKWGKK